MDPQKAQEWIEKKWQEEIQPTLEDYIRIPNMSKAFDPEWNTNGLLDQAATLLFNWAKMQNLQNATFEYLRDEDKSPLILITVEGTTPNCQTVVIYGHFDKQPPFTGWMEGLAYNKPVVIDDKLYGRGAGDDGYSIFGAVSCIKICQEQGLPHPRCVILIEGDEESGSTHFPLYLEKIKHKLGEVAVVFCLDGGTLNYEQFWTTYSLRGVVNFNLNVKILNEGVHSGDASGVVPSSFRVLRNLLERIENGNTGQMIDQLQVEIPPERLDQAVSFCNCMGEKLIQKFPFCQNVKPTTNNFLEAYLNRTWRSQLEVTGADNLPPTQIAGNVLRPETTVKLSIRIPPTKNPEEVINIITNKLTEDPPYNALISCTNITHMKGWDCPPIQSNLEKYIQDASQTFYGKQALPLLGGGSIPLMGLLKSLFPQSQFLVTGVMGPNSNAHGPNEFLHMPFTKKLICCMAKILSELYQNLKQK